MTALAVAPRPRRGRRAAPGARPRARCSTRCGATRSGPTGGERDARRAVRLGARRCPLAGGEALLLPAARDAAPLGGRRARRGAVAAVAPFALFGLRACDAHGARLPGPLLRARPALPGAGARRRSSSASTASPPVTVASAATWTPGRSRAAGFDLALTPLADGRVVAVAGTDAGRAVLGAAGIAVAADPARARGRPRRRAAAPRRRRFPAAPVHRARASRASTDAPAIAGRGRTSGTRSARRASPAPAARRSARRARASRSSTRAGPSGGERVRYWDSCLLEGFQREASGHHPAPHPGDRVRRFWYHKLSRRLRARVRTRRLRRLRALRRHLPRIDRRAARARHARGPADERCVARPAPRASHDVADESADTRTFVLALDGAGRGVRRRARPGQFVMLSVARARRGGVHARGAAAAAAGRRARSC